MPDLSDAGDPASERLFIDRRRAVQPDVAPDRAACKSIAADHVSSILAKLDLNFRTAAAYAIRQHLV